ncbi:HAD hydrolase-like protein [Pedobacter sp. HMF7647]|uniref:HAD hydrolase-like protein n=1 Tax=Hufsiella arboris TaxID=2695275 RepID=A0A7K1YD75_9SPHI|nr:HAD hydrolase-like protein [Hufsiella arboris]MXV52049.1 HAD hydrolase-like protein [Hufsiella arboris]
MIKYADLDPRKKAFIFELDDVLYPQKDYLLQVYYLFASFIEYTETVPPAADLTAFMKKVYENYGSDRIFEKASEAFAIDKKYQDNFERLHITARLPLKLILFPEMLSLLQEIVVDRKSIFIVTNGNPEQQLNKIRQIEWNGLENYLRVFFADEIKPKPDSDVFTYILEKHQLLRRDVLIIGATNSDEDFAAAAGADYLDVTNFR